MNKKDFQVFEKNDVVYLDSAATTQRPKVVVEALVDAYVNRNANAHRAGYELSIKATEGMEEAREKFAKFVGARKEEIIFAKNTTEILNNLARSIPINLEDDVLVTDMEHHSNFVPWQQEAKQVGATFRSVPLNPKTYELDFNIDLIKSNTKVFSFTGMSNVSGYMPNIKEIVRQIREKNPNTIIILDACQLAPHKIVDVKELDVDFMAFSVHKLYGPFGVGVMYGKYELLEKLEPFLYGGSMIGKVSLEVTTWADIPHRFEAGTMDSSSIMTCVAAIDYLNKLSIEKIEENETKLLELAKQKLNEIEGVHIIGHQDENNYGPLLSFYVDGVDADDIATMLGSKGICVRSGKHCAEPFLNAIGVQGTVRLSFGIYNDESDVEKFISALNAALKLLR
ncbi:aminotransferase class V-fold PLP-dependent enzyme [Candidatus Woesearchaeota archaeon]|nr:aminotransferase class V-fold PLP-dependent enzyme [Candidatus Woesearchaeota archaeon]